MALPCWGALNHDSSGGNKTTVTVVASPWTFSFTNTAGTVAYCWITWGQLIPTSPAVTFGGTSMTQLGSVSANNGTTDYISLWRLTSPATGAQTISASWTGASSTMMGSCVSFTGNATPPDSGTAITANDGGTFAQTTWPLAFTGTTSGNFLIQGVCYGDQTESSSTGTIVAIEEVDSGTFCDNMTSQYQAAGGSVTLSVTGTTATSWATLGIEVKAAAGGGAVIGIDKRRKLEILSQ